MKIKIIAISGNVYSAGHWKRSVTLRQFLLKKKIKVKLINISKNHAKNFVLITNQLIKEKSLNFLILDVSNFDFIKKKKVIKSIETLIKVKKKKLVITDGLGQDCLTRKIKNKNFILHLPYFLSKKNKEALKLNTIKNKMIGLKYAIIENRKNISQKKTNQQNTLVSLGGSDIHNKSLKLLHLLKKFDFLNVFFVIGPFFDKKKIIKIIKVKKNYDFKILKFKENLSNLFNQKKYLIVNSGLSKYECLYTKKPVMVIFENKKIWSLNQEFVNKKVTFNLKLFEKKTIIENKIKKFFSNNFNFTIHLNNRKRLVHKNCTNNFYLFLKKLK